jgi:hypothetical protein
LLANIAAGIKKILPGREDLFMLILNTYFFLVVSALILDVVSVAILELSVLTPIVSVLTALESVFTVVVESVVVVLLAELLQAANTAATESTAKIFFMTCYFKGFYNCREGKIF